MGFGGRGGGGGGPGSAVPRGASSQTTPLSACLAQGMDGSCCVMDSCATHQQPSKIIPRHYVTITIG